MKKTESELCAQNSKSLGFIVLTVNAFFCRSSPSCILYTGTSYRLEKGNVTHRKEQMLPHLVKNVQHTVTVLSSAVCSKKH